jgi:hypothetical protein
MNKYQEALYRLRLLANYAGGKDVEYIHTLQEIVDRAIPMKPIMIENGVHFECASCNGAVEPIGESVTWYKIFKPHCSYCGQAIDWSD